MTGHFDPRPITHRFWDRAGAMEPFPRRLTPTIAAVLPVAVVLLPKLTVAATADWLAKRGAACLDSYPDRPLRGCLVAQRGHAFMFIDGCLTEDEHRLTVAHETAHFLHHYESPRATALELLGASVAPVLDGDRPATSNERLRGALRGVPIGIYEHMLDRSGEILDASIGRLEAEADLIAFELLAPANVVLRRTKAGADCCAALQDGFGLPRWAAARWGEWIDARRRGDPLFQRLQKAREKIGR